MKFIYAVAGLSAWLSAAQAQDSYITVNYYTSENSGGGVYQIADRDCANVGYDQNDKVRSVTISDGDICIFWADYNCHGKHTDVLKGTADTGSDIGISSMKCCSQTDTWCA
ncbi:hypothetical protein F4778DRAFT_793532 [Xylariomycetidae sp. FL2044]|nr:hypothetical protein F4778DRAFT_793532 [Xylariomycetidae sp. FL2044]